MAKPFSSLEARMSPEAKAKASEKTQRILRELALQELREARQRSQESLAKKLGVKQAAISKMERRTDMYLSSLRGYVRAMGGKLRLVAEFADEAVEIRQLGTLKQTAPKRASSRTPAAVKVPGATKRPVRRK